MISSIAFSFEDFSPLFANDPVTMLLYEGVGIAGTLLDTSMQTLTPGINAVFVDFDFSSVSLTVGALYTAIVQAPNARWAINYEASGNPYAGGTMISGGSVFQDLDLRFRVTPLSTVPVPAAVWLFGTALIGLAGFSKRRKIA